jgi:hypothetical protein
MIYYIGNTAYAFIRFFVKATVSDFRNFLASHDVFGDNVVNTSSIEFEED